MANLINRMARILPLSDKNFTVVADDMAGQVIGSANARATLCHSVPALDAYHGWYPLYEAIEEQLGRRSAYLFAFTICHTMGCSLYTAYFRKLIIEAGEVPELLVLNEKEKILAGFGKSIAHYQGNIADHIYNSVAALYSKEELVLLAAFAGQLIAANIFNNIIETDVDETLSPYLPPVKSIWKNT